MRVSLVAGHRVVLRNVGTLEPYDKKAQKYRHPDTGAMRTAKRTRFIRFKLAAGLRDEL